MDKNRKEKMNMRLAEKIFNERKRLGLSQEQFAEQMEVSRQAVSKWESGQSMPDLDKIVLMSQIFRVSTDYLLKEEADTSFRSETAMEEAGHIEESASFMREPSEEEESVRKLKEEEIKEYQAICFSSSKRISFGVFLCIFGAVLLNGVDLYLHPKGIDSNLSVVPMLLCVAIAVGLFVFSGMQMEKYEYLKKQPFLLPEEEKIRLTGEYEGFYKVFVLKITTGIILCVGGIIAFILCNAVGEIHSEKIYGKTMMEYIAIMVLLFFIAIAVCIFVSAGMRKTHYDVLLQRDGFSEIRKKEESKNGDVMGVVAGVYWCIVTAVFLAYSLTTGNWGRSWIVWPVTGCIFGAISTLITFYKSRETE